MRFVTAISRKRQRKGSKRDLEKSLATWLTDKRFVVVIRTFQKARIAVGFLTPEHNRPMRVTCLRASVARCVQFRRPRASLNEPASRASSQKAFTAQPNG